MENKMEGCEKKRKKKKARSQAYACNSYEK